LVIVIGMTKEFTKLIDMERSRAITIGLNRNYANNFWYRTTKIGKPLNLLTNAFIILTIFVFIKIGLKEGLLALLLTGFYSVSVQKIAGWHVRSKLLSDEVLFNVAYEAWSATLKNNSSGEIIHFPTSWKEWIG